LPQILRHRWRRFLRRRNKAINVYQQRFAFVTLTKNRFSSCQCSPSSFISFCSMVNYFFYFNHPPPILPLRLPSLASVPFEISIDAVIAGISKFLLIITSFLYSLHGRFLAYTNALYTFVRLVHSFVMMGLYWCVFFLNDHVCIISYVTKGTKLIKHPLL